MHYALITSQAALEDYLADIGPDHVLAVDTEFFRETTYFPQLGLVQLAYDGRIACIDPLAFDATPTLASVLLDDSILKLFHSCSQDMEVMLHYLGGLPCPVHDTQVAAALIADRDQVSYADIVARYCDIELEKSQTRTNWLKRPLSDKQLTYAAEDVHYLHAVYEQLLDKLVGMRRRQWFEHDCRQLCASASRYQPDYDNVWLRVKGTQKLAREQLAVVDALARWREHTAVRLDLTRRKVASDDAIVAAATALPQSIEQLRSRGTWHRSLQAGDYRAALDAIHDMLESDTDSWPNHQRQQQTPEQRALIKELMTTVEQTAQGLGIAQSVLASRKDIEKLVNGSRDLVLLSDWRREIIGDKLLSMLPEQD